MLASVIIRTLNEEKYLHELLTAIYAQKCDRVGLEVVIVDSGSTDNTLHIAEEFGCRITYIDKSEFTFGRSLNIGCEFSTGDFLVFISGHCIPTSTEWLDNLCSPLIDHECSYSYGRQVGRDTTKYSEQCHFNKWFPEYNKIPQKGFFCNNANAAVTRSAWELLRFDEALTGLEDMHLAKRLITQGYSIAYISEAPVYHIHDETWKHVRIRYEREAYALKEIMPEVHFSFPDFLRYYISSIMSDSASAIRDKTLLTNFKDILFFRFNHYWGTYKGNHEVRSLSKAQKKNYFYPKDLERDHYNEK
ncbi:glycosyltransferase [Amphritea sp.]|uniref:glycosyltransferase n=1 Tax=Amphritea sp. TaxID=1872502 RepID=UPI003A937118